VVVPNALAAAFLAPQMPLGYETMIDARVEVTHLFATEDRAVVECILRGTHSGPLHGPAGALPPSGRSMRLQACEVFQVSNGMIVSHHTYYDMLGLLQQLGALPAAG